MICDNVSETEAHGPKEMSLICAFCLPQAIQKTVQSCIVLPALDNLWQSFKALYFAAQSS